ncbi:hypothetical protein CYMTET_23076 [Cymbomonas tetramitiformis]|uniref:Uncharacterized protein n=1 Tax=Cymbomonas tetramitiformis TaxID=36881 RepID=A0AAE0FZ69_9CHLO|nr:hypothetical protein CYMTET_23076 [Cymbomonas tetramitiformis]
MNGISQEEYDRLLFAGDDDELDESDSSFITENVDAALSSNTAVSVTSFLDSTGVGFAHPGNLEYCVPYILQSLASFGYPSKLDLHSSEPSDVAAICNCFYVILSQRQNDVQYRDTILVQQRKLKADLQAAQNQMRRANEVAEAKERELGSRYVQERTAMDAQAKHLHKVTAERDELQRNYTGIAQKQAQFQHEIRKKEREFTKIQERMNVLLAEKQKSLRDAKEKASMVGQGVGPPKAGKAARTKQDEDFTKMVIESYETKQKDLIAENGDLRLAVYHLQEELKELMNIKANPTEPEEPAPLAPSLEDLEDGHLKETLVAMRERLEMVRLSCKKSPRSSEQGAVDGQLRALLLDHEQLMTSVIRSKEALCVELEAPSVVSSSEPCSPPAKLNTTSREVGLDLSNERRSPGKPPLHKFSRRPQPSSPGKSTAAEAMVNTSVSTSCGPEDEVTHPKGGTGQAEAYTDCATSPEMPVQGDTPPGLQHRRARSMLPSDVGTGDDELPPQHRRTQSTMSDCGMQSGAEELLERTELEGAHRDYGVAGRAPRTRPEVHEMGVDPISPNSLHISPSSLQQEREVTREEIEQQAIEQRMRSASFIKKKVEISKVRPCVIG